MTNLGTRRTPDKPLCRVCRAPKPSSSLPPAAGVCDACASLADAMYPMNDHPRYSFLLAQRMAAGWRVPARLWPALRDYADAARLTPAAFKVVLLRRLLPAAASDDEGVRVRLRGWPAGSAEGIECRIPAELDRTRGAHAWLWALRRVVLRQAEYVLAGDDEQPRDAWPVEGLSTPPAPPDVLAQLCDLREKLTPRERDVLQVLAADPDAGAADIAAVLGLSDSTVRTHLQRIREKAL